MRLMQGDVEPYIFYVSMPDVTSIILSAYSAVIDHVLGQGWLGPKRVDIWDPAGERWCSHYVSEPIGVECCHTVFLVRYPGNKDIRGAGPGIAVLQEQTFHKLLMNMINDRIDMSADIVRSV